MTREAHTILLLILEATFSKCRVVKLNTGKEIVAVSLTEHRSQFKL